MNYLILVSHGGLAEGLRTSLEMFAEDAMAEVIALGLKNGSSVDEFAEEFRMAVSHIGPSNRVIVLADIIGGSPLTTALGILEEKGLIRDAKLFYFQEVLSAYRGKMQPGFYTLNTSMTANDLMATMAASAEKEEEDQ